MFVIIGCENCGVGCGGCFCYCDLLCVLLLVSGLYDLGIDEGRWMIGKVFGILEYKVVDYVLIDVCGIGYVVYLLDWVMLLMFYVGEVVVFYIDFLVCEDLM